MEIEQAKDNVNELFKNLAPLVQELVDKYSFELDKIINKISKSDALTNDELRNYILALSVESYLFGISKDASILKQECATTLMKEGIAQEFNNATGTQQARNNTSMINTTDKQVVNLLFNAVANMMKTKLDETHRMINALNSILISRNAEAKLAGNGTESETPARQILNESR